MCKQGLCRAGLMARRTPVDALGAKIIPRFLKSDAAIAWIRPRSAIRLGGDEQGEQRKDDHGHEHGLKRRRHSKRNGPRLNWPIG